MMFKGSATHLTIPLDQQEWLPSDKITFTGVTNDLRIGDHLLCSLYNQTTVSC